ncbi:hypothetical protein [Streptomyces alboflavus]|uniref:hypothetical protein n=1 Tax=Streptomyces alboflavus TaxID=67267 RepID=UPI0004C0563A|nr:hypothetical protein [Streptomyces alboflavus]
MGTNYFVRTPPCADACAHCSASEELHLGKSSAGWRFLFQAGQDWPREKAYSLWVERAKSGVINDEYGRTVTLDELLALVEAKQGGRSHTAYDPEARRVHGAALYDSLRASDFECEGFDFCDRHFS